MKLGCLTKLSRILYVYIVAMEEGSSRAMFASSLEVEDLVVSTRQAEQVVVTHKSLIAKPCPRLIDSCHMTVS